MRVLLNTTITGIQLSQEALAWLIDHRGFTVGEYRWGEGEHKRSPGAVVDSPGVSSVDFPTGFDVVEYVPPDTREYGAGRYSLWRWENGRNDEMRSDPDVLAAFDALGDRFNGKHCTAKAVEVPDGVDWYVESCYEIIGDGPEAVVECYRIWE
jgi:hypothetical protein